MAKNPKDINSQPFFVPFDNPASGIALHFNYWMKTKYLESGGSLMDVFTALVRGDDDLVCLSLRTTNPSPSIPPLKVMFVCLQGIDFTTLSSLQLQELAFLSQCSSCPVRHTSASSSTPVTINRNATPSTETLYSTFLWPVKPPLAYSALKGLTSLELFRSYSLSFQATHTSWQDEIQFNCHCDAKDSQQNAKRLYDTLIQQKKDSFGFGGGLGTSSSTGDLSSANKVNNFVLSSYDAEPQEGEIELFGRFKRKAANDSGLFMYRSTVDDAFGMLILAWYKGGVHRLDLIPAYNQGLDDLHHTLLDPSIDDPDTDNFSDMGVPRIPRTRRRSSLSTNGDDVEPLVAGGPILEFALCVDEKSKFDLYLELTHAVEAVSSSSGSGSSGISDVMMMDGQGLTGDDDDDEEVIVAQGMTCLVLVWSYPLLLSLSFAYFYSLLPLSSSSSSSSSSSTGDKKIGGGKGSHVSSQGAGKGKTSAPSEGFASCLREIYSKRGVEFSAATINQNGSSDSNSGGANSGGANSSSSSSSGMKKRNRETAEDSKINSSNGQITVNSPSITVNSFSSSEKRARLEDGAGSGLGVGVGLHCHLDAPTLERLSQLYEDCAGPCLDGNTHHCYSMISPSSFLPHAIITSLHALSTLY